MKCLVTGSEGFIGKNLVALLKVEGHQVVSMDVKQGFQGNILWLNSEKTEEEHPFICNPDVDVIYHLACINQMQAIKDPAKNILINARGTQLVAKFARQIGAKFVYTSTASVYGNAETIPTPVDAKLAPLTDYAVAKLAGEHFVQNSGADWTILRLSNVYGPYQTLDNPYCGVIGRFIQQALTGQPLTVIGDGTQTRDFSFVGDVVDYLLDFVHPTLYPQYEHKILNVSSGQETSVSRIAKTVCVQTGGFFRTGEDKRPIDSVDRRLLVPDLVCGTDLDIGLHKTIMWFRGVKPLLERRYTGI